MAMNKFNARTITLAILFFVDSVLKYAHAQRSAYQKYDTENMKLGQNSIIDLENKPTLEEITEFDFEDEVLKTFDNDKLYRSEVFRQLMRETVGTGIEVKAQSRNERADAQFLSTSKTKKQTTTTKNAIKSDFLDIDRSSIVRKPGYCTLKRQCGYNPAKNSNYPMPCLANNTQAFTLKDNTEFQLLKETCPDIAKDGKVEDTLVCCDVDGLRRIADGFTNAKAIYARCPACWYSFRQSACQATCNPDQALFVDPAEFIDPVYDPENPKNNPDEPRCETQEHKRQKTKKIIEAPKIQRKLNAGQAKT